MSATREILPPSQVVAVDAMGGDHSPDVIVAGVAEAARLHSAVTFLLFGESQHLRKLISKFPEVADRIVIRASDVVIPDDEKPSRAMREEYESSSLSKAIIAAALGEAQSVVSAANTGIVMALAMQHIGLIEGISRPAVASYMPTLRNESVVLDLGANLTVKGEHLFQFAILGTALAQTMLAIPNPRIGLLNIGTERTKGPNHIQRGYELIKGNQWPGDFVGFSEPHDLVNGDVDVLVCDGYAGNIMLKSTEATAHLIGAYTKASFKETFLSRLGYMLAARQFAKLRRRTDPRRYNGAVMAGLKKVCVKSHGGADSLSFTAALELSIDMVNEGYATRVSDLLPS